MRKRIAVFEGEPIREFQNTFTQSIFELAKENDFDVFVFCNLGSYTNNPLFEIGERNIIEIPDFSKFDAVISLSDTFDIDGMEELLLSKINTSNPDCPIVTVRNGPLGTYRVLVDDYDTTYQIVNHFIKNRHFSRICYMSGNRDVPDSLTRQQAYVEAMTNAGLRVTDSMTFEGDYWYTHGEPAVEQFLKAFPKSIYGEDNPDAKIIHFDDDYLLPEAIVCGNDYMAISVCNALKKRGIRIPEDICIFGFDEALEGVAYEPQLSTVSMPTVEMAKRTIQIIVDTLNGKTIEHDCFVRGDLKFKASSEINIPKANFDAAALVNEVAESSISLKQSALIFIDLQNHITADDKLAFLESYFYKTNCERGYICLCSEQNDVDVPRPYSDDIILRDIYPYKDATIKKECLGTTFSRSEILPEEVFMDSSTPSRFFIMPIHFKDMSYGYFVMEPSNKLFDYFVTTLTTALAYTYEDLSLMRRLDQLGDIRRQSLIDPLTGVGNRRSFDQYLNSISQRLKTEGGCLSIVMADLDYLKYVNDNYGHDEGDFVIKEFAAILKGLTDSDDLCARVGGDEFACVLYSKTREKHDTFEARAYEAITLREKTMDKPYKFHASFGSCSYDEYMGASLLTCMKLADERMYFAKSEYKKNLAE
ncbi:MAG: GGDEF domain-containing protein [Clostridia bacterium]|nr:GGDEF domain-containing protein [Clostridia bacterium]